MLEILRNVLLLVCMASSAAAELFTAVAHLEPILNAEKNIAISLKTFISQERERLEKLQKIAADYERHSDAALHNPHFYLANPVNAFLLIKRFTLDWDRDIGPILNNNTWKDFKWNMQHARKDLPKFEDFTGAATALIRLQDTYHLDISKVSHGSLGGVKSMPLSADDCFELAKLSFSKDDSYHTVLWGEEALALLGNDKSTKEKHIKLLEYLAPSYSMQGHVKHALTLTNELLTLDPGNKKAFNNKLDFENILKNQSKDNQLNDEECCPVVQRVFYENRHQTEEFSTYEALCRGETIQKIEGKHKLKCRYVHNNHPLLILSPVKEEEVHLDPWIVLYHDVVSDSEINDIKFMATPRLRRASITNSVTGQNEMSAHRISKIVWLSDKDHPTIEKINCRIEAITGLDVSTAKQLQMLHDHLETKLLGLYSGLKSESSCDACAKIRYCKQPSVTFRVACYSIHKAQFLGLTEVVNYGLGGQYEAHWDFTTKEEEEVFGLDEEGNRIATYLTYLTDVEAGGATVFPYLGLKLFPKKGAAAFWFNLYKSGDGIYDTLHAACPVLVGVKWAANKWIGERGQEWRRPCSLSPDE